MDGRPPITTIRTTPHAVEKLKAVRDALQMRTPLTRISLHDALTFAVSSAAAALIEDQPGGKRDDRAA